MSVDGKGGKRVMTVRVTETEGFIINYNVCLTLVQEKLSMEATQATGYWQLSIISNSWRVTRHVASLGEWETGS